MSWTTPKTNWVASDYFNATDYNRIKNNLAYLYDLAVSIYGSFDITPLGSDKSIGDFLIANDIDTLEVDLKAINENSVDQDYGDTQRYYANDKMPDYAELNRIESATASLYNHFNNE